MYTYTEIQVTSYHHVCRQTDVCWVEVRGRVSDDGERKSDLFCHDNDSYGEVISVVRENDNRHVTITA